MTHGEFTTMTVVALVLLAAATFPAVVMTLAALCLALGGRHPDDLDRRRDG
jgi:hypothetical protein